MKRRSILLLALVCAILPTALQAQLAPVPNPVEYLNFIGGSGINSNQPGIPSEVGPYKGQFIRPGPGGIGTPQFSLYCVDYLNTATDQWVNATSIGPTAVDAGMGNTRLGATAGAVAKYTQAAYLTSLFASWATWVPSGTTQQTAFTAIQGAIWSIVGGTTIGGSFALRDTFMAQAGAAVAGGWTANEYYVLSPVSPANGQEFIIKTVVPEPSTYVLLATGLLFLVAFARRRTSKEGAVA